MQVLEEFIDVVKRLRDPEHGCPWDQKLTYKKLYPYVIEEAYELAEALESADPNDILEEAGDVLLHIIMIAQMATEKGQFELSDIIDCVKKKMIRRHPHVFGDKKVKDVDDVWKNWEAIKRQEKTCDSGVDYDFLVQYQKNYQR